MKALVLGMVDALLDVRRAHVIDHHPGWQSGEKILKLRQIRHFEIDDNVPAELFDAGGDPLQHVARGEIDEPLEEIKAHAAHAGFVHPFELVVSDFFTDKSDALGSAM